MMLPNWIGTTHHHDPELTRSLRAVCGDRSTGKLLAPFRFEVEIGVFEVIQSIEGKDVDVLLVVGDGNAVEG